MFFSIYLIIGAFSGTLAGLLGLGGGVIVVPALAAIFTHYHVVPAQYIMQMAVGTSLSTIVFTFLSSLRAHMQRNSVRWNLVKQFLPGLLSGVLLGSFIAKNIPSAWLSVFFSLFLLFIAGSLLRNKIKEAAPLKLPLAAIVSITMLIGILTCILGAGGGVMMIPFMLRLKVSMREATGTSVACGVFMAALASCLFMLLGHNSNLHLPYSTGFVYWPAFAGIAAASVLFAPIGTALAYKLQPTVLKRLLAIFLVLVAIDMLLPAAAF